MVDCKTCEYENVCTMPDFVRNDLKRCKVYQEKKLQSQADRIRAMSDEELAEFITKQFCHGVGYPLILEWLKSEVKE